MDRKTRASVQVSKRSKGNPVLAARVDREVFARFKEIAAARGLASADLLRELVERASDPESPLSKYLDAAKALDAAREIERKIEEAMKEVGDSLVATGLFEWLIDERDIAPGKPVRYVLRPKVAPNDAGGGT
jgi:antitoxin component of RelBE/YafQ-DinJ toxin-antitoxin module